MTGLEILLGLLLAAIVACILALRLGFRKPQAGGNKEGR